MKLYGKSRLGEDFLVNLTMLKDGKTELTFKIRSKDRAVLNMIMKKLKEIKFKIE